MKVGVAKETAPGERRVALVPEALGKLQAAGLEILVEAGAGAGSAIPDSAYTEAGATVVPTDALYQQADVVLRVAKPDAPRSSRLRTGQAVIGLLAPLIDPNARQGPRREGRHGHQPRRDPADAVAGAVDGRAQQPGERRRLQGGPHRRERVRALLPVADHGRGHGQAGQRAHPRASASRGSRRSARPSGSGAVVKAYDVRPETREQAESLGAQFVKLKTTIDATGAGGYARELTAEERAAQQAELNEVIGGMDVVITTAQVPGRKPPVLVTADAVAKMKPGSVIVDMAASALGGNCELSKAGETVVTPNGVTIIAPENLPASDAGRGVRVLRPQHLGAAARDGQGRRAQPRLRGRGHEGHGHHQGRRGRVRRRRTSCSNPEARHDPRRDRRACSQALTIFTLAILVGFAVISKVPATLHTPLMSGANSIHGIVLVGAMLIAAEADDGGLSQALSLIAVAFATMNVVGGYVVTDRMLQMFRKKPVAPKPAADEAEA